MGESYPDSIGSYRILSKLGQGGMGSVYRAVQGTLERPVALKVLPPEFSNHTEYVARFLREARTIAAIRHENIIQVYDSGEYQGQYYIAMELVDGGNLLNVADAREKVSETDGLNMMLQAARGLNAAHAKGLIHRDIKPENLLLGTDKVVRIVDFGLVMDSGSATQLTLAGTCLGTPMYMSPEQADGETADPRSDLYSLGATFFRVFTGQPPFGSATVMNILYKQKFEQPADPQSLRPDLSRGAADLLLHLLAKRRDDRPEGATALIAMIQDVLAGKPIPAPPPFAPLIPKLVSNETGAESGQRQNVSSETAAIFGSDSRRSGPESDSKSGLLAAAIFVIIFAAAVFAIASGSKPEKPEPPKPKVVKAPVQITDAEVKERIALGDRAFKAGRIKDARAIYLEALKLVPGHVDLISRRDRSDRRIGFDNTMIEAAELEKQGRLSDALERFKHAQALDEESAAQVCIDRVAAAIEAAKKPVASFAPATPRDPKMEELERVEREADDARKHDDFAKAESLYLRAAELSPPAQKGPLLDKARQSARLKFLSLAKLAEAAGDLPRAESSYAKALEILHDDTLAERLNLVRQKIRADEKHEADYAQAMREGQDALERNDFKTARVKFGQASGFKPDVSPPAAKLNEVDAREFFLIGDKARDVGDLNEARKAYETGLTKCPALENEVQTKIKALEKAPTRADIAVSKATALADARQDDEALVVLDDALKIDPNATPLKTARAALESARNAEDVFEQLQKIAADAMDRLRMAGELDEEDEVNKTHVVNVAKLQLSLLDKSKKPLSAFAAGEFLAAGTFVATARSLAGDMQVELHKAATHFTKQAEKVDGFKVFFAPKMAVGGDRKKAEKYRAQAEAMNSLASQAKAIQKTQ
ncbi:MAG: protein kinase [Planctomycetota bacterium]